ncbi:glutamine-hydrolyzing GMP synthase, partial [Patescibacteria group bacterium]|nr:glutamine-hydrolyzing GMP synthase [Patescibacteria group bacterium]
MIYVVDFGSQTAHLIARRIKELGFSAELLTPGELLDRIKRKKPNGIIFSGGPSSVYEKNSPSINIKVFNFEIPILGVCYGFQLMVHLLGGKVVPGKKEYGPTKCQISNTESQISGKLPRQFTVWMSHGDEVIRLPKGFEALGSTDHVPYSLVGDLKKNIYGLQFHPEVEHTQNGLRILSNFLGICGFKTRLDTQGKLKSHDSKVKITTQKSKIKNEIPQIIEKIRKTAGED